MKIELCVERIYYARKGVDEHITQFTYLVDKY